MRTATPVVAVIVTLLACSKNEAPTEDLPPAEPAALSVETLRSEIEDLGGMNSWVFDIDVTNEGDSTFSGYFFVHAETPTGDAVDRGVFPLRAGNELSNRTEREEFVQTIGTRLLELGGALEIDSGSTERIEGGIVLAHGNYTPYDDVVLFVYDAEGRRVFEQPVASP